jgi:hypothetical protein
MRKPVTTKTTANSEFAAMLADEYILNFCSLFSFGASRRITSSNRINNELCIFNQQQHRADETQYRHIANASTLCAIGSSRLKYKEEGQTPFIKFSLIS